MLNGFFYVFLTVDFDSSVVDDYSIGDSESDSEFLSCSTIGLKF